MDSHYQGTIWTKHAISRLYNRGISQSDAWYAFAHADGDSPGKTPGSRKFYKNSGSQRIEVVAKKNDQGTWVVLSVWSKYPGQYRQTKNTDNFLERIVKFFLRY